MIEELFDRAIDRVWDCLDHVEVLRGTERGLCAENLYAAFLHLFLAVFLYPFVIVEELVTEFCKNRR